MRPRTDRRLLTVLLLCLVVVSGCAVLTQDEDLSARITEAGYSDVQVVHSDFEGFDRVVVYASGGAEHDNGEDIARLVWDTYPSEVDELTVERGRAHFSGSAAELEELFGPRKIKPDPNTVLKWTAGIAAFLLLLCGGLVVLVLVLVRRRVRASRATRA
ncbi:MAG: hypothetical protein HOY78_04220 [Saccharothrix sp.]|nr:hypothetical protein [Saccharothrix sp.]